jgi:hypothetical protein
MQHAATTWSNIMQVLCLRGNKGGGKVIVRAEDTDASEMTQAHFNLSDHQSRSRAFPFTFTRTSKLAKPTLYIIIQHILC